MGRKRGMCHICGEMGELTFEHIPPRRLFNDRPVLLETLYGLQISNRTGRPPPPLELKAGMGKRTLCRSCNGWTAVAYGDAFAEWAMQTMRYESRSTRSGRISVPFDIEPLRVVKQVLTMCLAATDFAGPRFHQTLRRLVLVPFERYIPPPYRLHAYFTGGEPRMTSVAAVVNVKKGPQAFVMAEIAFRPMGYCLSIVGPGEQSMAEAQGLCDITHFARYRLGERAQVWLRLPKLEPIGCAPLAYKP